MFDGISQLHSFIGTNNMRYNSHYYGTSNGEIYCRETMNIVASLSHAERGQ